MNIRLIVMLHGVGASSAAMAPFAAALDAVTGIPTVVPDGPEPFDLGAGGRQWFSVRGITGADRPSRVADALPGVLALVDRLALSRGLERREVALLGFSQGAIMTLAAVAAGAPFGAAVVIAGRLAATVGPPATSAPPVLLLHDRSDPVMPFRLAGEAKAALEAAGHRAELVATDGYGHAPGPATVAAAAAFLTGSRSVPQPPERQELHA